MLLGGISERENETAAQTESQIRHPGAIMDRALTIIPLLLSLSALGAAVRPVVTFAPDWNKIFLEESITMTCNVGPTEPGDPIVNWYKDNIWIHAGKVYTIAQAQESDGGKYQCQCQADDSERSDAAKLEVHTSYVILQTPLHVYEGDNVTLRCHHYPVYDPGQTIFSKDGEVVQNWGSKSELLVENVDMKSDWRYSCTKEVYHNLLPYHHSGDADISVQELFPPPVLRLLDLKLTCDTRMTPLREATQLQFAFYRDGEEVSGWSTSEIFSIPTTWQEKSETYKCQVRCPSNSLVKTSQTWTTGAIIEVEAHKPVSALFVTCAALVIFLLILVSVGVYRKLLVRLCSRNQQLPDLMTKDVESQPIIFKGASDDESDDNSEDQ